MRKHRTAELGPAFHLMHPRLAGAQEHGRRYEAKPASIATRLRFLLDSERAPRLPETMRRGVIVLLSVVLSPALAGAQCTTKTDASAVQKSIKLAASCNYKKLLKGPAITCKTSAAPACAGTLVGDAIALAWGANDPAAAAV